MGVIRMSKCKRCGKKEIDFGNLCYDCQEELHPGIHKQMEEEKRTLDIIAKQARK